MCQKTLQKSYWKRHILTKIHTLNLKVVQLEQQVRQRADSEDEGDEEVICIEVYDEEKVAETEEPEEQIEGYVRHTTEPAESVELSDAIAEIEAVYRNANTEYYSTGTYADTADTDSTDSAMDDADQMCEQMEGLTM